MSAGDSVMSLEQRSQRAVSFVLVGAVVLVAAVAAVGLVATGSTAAVTDDAANESSPPELDSGEKLNTTAVELLFVDSEGINTSSIATDDFLLSDGELSHVDATATGTDARVTLVLAEPIPNDELTVGIATDSDIQNVNGTQIRTDEGSQSVTISEMDGIPPSVLGASVDDAIGGPAEIQYRFDEPVSALDVEVTGPANATLDIDNFENPNANRYVTEYEPPKSGEYEVTLRSVTDEVGNTGNTSIVRTMKANRTAPNAVIGIDFAASSGENVTFDAGESAGDRLNYTWEFGDGTNASGERVSHEFGPEEHTVTLTVENEFGKSDEDRLDLNLTDGLDIGADIDTDDGVAGPAVIVDRGESASSLVSVTGAVAGESLGVGTVDESEAPLLNRDAIALDSLSITPTANTSFSLALSAVGAGGVTDATDEDTVAIGGFTVLNDLNDRGISSAEFAFSVDVDRLDTLGLSSDDVELHREVDGTWEALETDVMSDDGDHYQFAAITPGFSRFAVVGTDSEDGNGATQTDGSSENGPDTQVVDATVNETEVDAGASIEVTATVENRGEETESFRAGLELDGEVVETRESPEIAGGESETVLFTPSLDDSGTVSVAVNGTAAGEVTVEESEGGEEDELDINEEQFTVTDVTLNETSIDPGEVVRVEGWVLNEGEEMADYVAELEVDGETVDTFDVPQVPAGEDIPVTFEERFDGEGTYTISISGTESESELAVGQGGLLSFLPLGFLPLGLLRTVLAFVGIPLLFIYLMLKAVAFHLGY